jgi:hypothetical protein
MGTNMTYTITGTGPQFPRPYEQKAWTATHALTMQAAIEKLCGSAVVRDADSGRKIELAELIGLMGEEAEAERLKLVNPNA